MATMREAPEFGIPEVKPAIESIRGVWEQKVSPRRKHAILQARLAALFSTVFADRGEVGTEWRFYLLPPDERPSSLVPDLALVSYERMPEELGELREQPTIAPDIAVEIVSPDEKPAVLAKKIGLYLESGAQLVIVVNPQTRSVVFHDAHGTETITHVDGIAKPDAYPALAIDLKALFAKL